MNSTSITGHKTVHSHTSTKAFWKRYYYSCLQSFLSFLVPNDVDVLDIDEERVMEERKVTFSGSSHKHAYIIASDVLGYVSDIELFFRDAKNALADDGRFVLTQHNALWEPIIRLATSLGVRRPDIQHNWLSGHDIYNLLYLAGFDVVKWGTKILIPVYIPLVSAFFNKVVVNIWPFTRLGLFYYVVARKSPQTVEPLLRGTGPSFSIVVPARNESGTIERIARELPDLGKFTEIIFVEGNSTDDTYAEIQRVADLHGKNRRIKVLQQKGKGKGDAVRAGFEAAEGEILAIYDADMTVPSGEVHKFYDAIVSKKGDFINGSRLVYAMQKESMRTLNFFANKFFSIAFTWILGEPIRDTLCGTKVLRKSHYEAVKRGRPFFGEFDPFGDFDLLFGAAKLNLKIVDMPIHYCERVYGTTNISRWKHGWLLLKMTVFATRKMKFI